MEIIVTDIFNKTCLHLDLGEIKTEPKQLKGGFMHKMYSLFTTKSKYAIKLLNPHVMKHDTVFENYRIAEELEAKLEKNATYDESKAYVLEHAGLKVSNLYIAQAKQKCCIIERENYIKSKSENAKQSQCHRIRRRRLLRH